MIQTGTMIDLALPRPSITAAAAAALIDAAERHAASIGLAIVTVIVDESGVLKAMRRMDGAALVAIAVAEKKARTAVGFGIATGQPWRDFIGSDPILAAGAESIPDFTMFTGGIPLRVGGALVGAIGVSGGHYSHDEACAQAALAVVSFAKA